jgi:hypothetical protein
MFGRWIVVIAVLAAFFALAGDALAADPHSGGSQGQPSQSCQAEPTGPAGLLSTTNGFARIAVNVYAGSPGTNSLVSGNAHAVSQYDVACFEVSSSGHCDEARGCGLVAGGSQPLTRFGGGSGQGTIVGAVGNPCGPRGRALPGPVVARPVPEAPDGRVRFKLTHDPRFACAGRVPVEGV